jgi:multiple sugar transport system substrate-binding protein
MPDIMDIRTLLPRSLLLVLVSALIAAALCACTVAPAGQPMEPLLGSAETYGDLERIDPRNQVVVYWHQQAGAAEEALLELIDQFNASNDWNVTVIGEYAGSTNAIYDKVHGRVGSSALPGLVGAEPYQVASYAAQGASVALDPYVTSSRWGYTQPGLGDFFPSALAAGALPPSGAVYSWPLYKSMDLMVYNEDWLAELGYDGPPETWEQFAEMACRAAAQPFSGVTGEGRALGFEYSLDAARFATFVFSRGGDVVSEDGTRYVFNGPEGLEALTFLKDQVLFTISSATGLPQYEQAVSEGAGFQWSINPPPHTSARPRMNVYGASLAILKTTPQQQLAAWLFLKWMSEPVQQARWASVTGYYPTRPSAADLLATYFSENPPYAKAFEFLSYDYGATPSVTGYDECRSAIEEMLTAVMGGQGAQAQLDAAVARCNESLK